MRTNPCEKCLEMLRADKNTLGCGKKRLEMRRLLYAYHNPEPSDVSRTTRNALKKDLRVFQETTEECLLWKLKIK